MIPTYNAAKTVEETLRSILSQTYINLEIVIVDNASNDNTISIIKKFHDPRIKIIVHEKNLGAEGNFNRCIQLANGDYIAIYHADDLYSKTIVEKEVEFLESNLESGAVFTMGNIINEKNDIIGKFSIPKKLLNKTSIYHFREVLRELLQNGNSFLVCPSAMLRSYIYKNKIKRYREKLFKSASDVDVWIRVLESYPIGILNEEMMNYRLSSTQGSYKYNHRRMTKADGFLVYQYYFNKYKNILTKDDMRNFKFSEKKDELIRATNSILLKDILTARKILKNNPYSRDLAITGLKSFSNFKNYMAIIALRLTLKTGLSYPLAKFISKRINP